MSEEKEKGQLLKHIQHTLESTCTHAHSCLCTPEAVTPRNKLLHKFECIPLSLSFEENQEHNAENVFVNT